MKNKALLNNALPHPIATGRFAPSPTGDLHLGSLVAATASYLNIKHQSGRWLLRIDDIDAPRVISGSQDRIFRQLEAYEFEWDRTIIQSERVALYQDAFNQLERQQLTYGCDCTRLTIQERVGQKIIYDQHCRSRQLPYSDRHAIRIKTPDQPWRWQDAIQGLQNFDWEKQLGDFIIKRADAIWAYHLVAAVDDSDDGITEVIRGADLLTSTAPQQYIQTCLQRPSPSYAHHPILLDQKTNIKLSKASQANAIKADEAVNNLFLVLSFLNQQPPPELMQGSLNDIWQWAINHWSLDKVNAIADQGA